MTKMGTIYRKNYGGFKIKNKLKNEDKKKKFYQYSCPDGSMIIGWNETGILSKEEIVKKCSKPLPTFRVSVK